MICGLKSISYLYLLRLLSSCPKVHLTPPELDGLCWWEVGPSYIDFVVLWSDHSMVWYVGMFARNFLIGPSWPNFPYVPVPFFHLGRIVFCLIHIVPPFFDCSITGKSENGWAFQILGKKVIEVSLWNTMPCLSHHIKCTNRVSYVIDSFRAMTRSKIHSFPCPL